MRFKNISIKALITHNESHNKLFINQQIFCIDFVVIFFSLSFFSMENEVHGIRSNKIFHSFISSFNIYLSFRKKFIFHYVSNPQWVIKYAVATAATMIITENIIELQCNTQKSPNKFVKSYFSLFIFPFCSLSLAHSSAHFHFQCINWVYQKLSQLITPPWDSVVRTNRHSLTHTHTLCHITAMWLSTDCCTGLTGCNIMCSMYTTSLHLRVLLLQCWEWKKIQTACKESIFTIPM